MFMVKALRSKENPILHPDSRNAWEAEAAFNGSVIRENSTYTMLYRAISIEQLTSGVRIKQSTIGKCISGDGIHFRKREQFIVPSDPWDKFGCEDPRVTKLEEIGR